MPEASLMFVRNLKSGWTRRSDQRTGNLSKTVHTRKTEECLEHVRPQHVRPWKTEECPEHAHLKTSVQNVRLWKTEECPIGSTSGN